MTNCTDFLPLRHIVICNSGQFEQRSNIKNIERSDRKGIDRFKYRLPHPMVDISLWQRILYLLTAFDSPPFFWIDLVFGFPGFLNSMSAGYGVIVQF